MAVLSHEGTYPILYGPWPIPVGTQHRDGYIARPDEAGKFPVVLVVPDLNGLGSFEKDICRRLARSGFAALSLDMYGPEADPLKAYNALTDRRAATYLEEIHEFIDSDDVEWTVSGNVGILGTDVGGRFALMKAATTDWVRSVVVFSTPLTGDEEREFQVADYLDHLRMPVLGLYGADDELIDPESVDEAQRRNDHGQWLLYEDAGHGFLDINAPDFDQAAADDAFARIVAFCQATLEPAVVEDLG